MEENKKFELGDEDMDNVVGGVSIGDTVCWKERRFTGSTGAVAVISPASSKRLF